MRKWLALLIFCSCASSLAFAQSAEISVSGGVSRFNGDYATAGGGDNTPIKFTNGFRLVFRFTWNQGKFFSHEVGYGYARSHLHYQSNPVQDIAAVSLHQGLYNFLINATPEGSRVRPFATGGVHFTSFYPPASSVICSLSQLRARSSSFIWWINFTTFSFSYFEFICVIPELTNPD